MKKPSKSKNTFISLTIALILVLIITIVMTSSFSQLNFKINTDTSINTVSKQFSLPTNVSNINETDKMNVDNSINNYSSTLPTNPVSLDTPKSTPYKQSEISQISFSYPDYTIQEQAAESDVSIPISNNSSFTPTNVAPISLDNTNFTTYTYGGYSVQQMDSTRFSFQFPDSTNQGQIAGSDALSLNTYAIQKIDFDALFTATKINAQGFDEMAIFATSDTTTYKGTEFGIRLDLEDGFICGYIQEPNGTNGDVNFQMLNLTLNDELVHHYALIMQGSQISFYIDKTECGYLNFPSNNDYSNFNFSICSVVHRFTDDWDSVGDNMIAGNFVLN